MKLKRILLALGLVLASLAVPVRAQINMPDMKQVSGVPLPAADLPGGTVSVRVIRGSFANSLSGVDVDVVVDGKTTTLKTDAEGRVQMAGMRAGAPFKAAAVVAGERLETQQITIGQNGVRFVLSASDPEAAARAAEDQRLAAGPATKGGVVLGPESRIVAEFADDRLNVYYSIAVLNTARVPVDIGGPLIFTLPVGARGVAMLDGASPQATVQGAHVIATGPFAPGTTAVNIGFELPYSGGTARIEQVWPATLQQVQVFALKTGDMDMTSPQLTAKQVTSEQGQPILAGSGPAIPAGQSLAFEISGLPHHPVWPRYVALSLAALVMAAGIWAAASPTPRRAA